MSARDDLLYWTNEGLKEWGHDRTDDIQAKDLIDAFAHELAEEHAAMLRAYPDYRGVMDLAAALVLNEDHPHRRHDHPARPAGSEEASG